MIGKNDKTVKITFDAVSVIKVIGIVIASFVALLFISKVISGIILIIISIFLAIALNPVVSWLADKLNSKSRISATGAAYIIVIGFLIGFIFLVFPPIVTQTIDFVQKVPDTIQSTKNPDTAIGSFIERYGLTDEIDKVSRDFGSHFSDLGEPAIATAGKIISTVASVVVVLVLTFMMLVEGPSWIDRYFSVLQPKRREHQKMLGEKMYRVIVGYVNGQLFLAVLAGVFASLALFVASHILDIQINEIALGGIVAVFALIPLIGVITGAAIVILSSLAVSIPLAIIMTIFFIVYQQVETATLQPYVQSRTNTLTPLLVLIAAILGVGLSGLLGAILAIPVAGCIKIWFDDYFERRQHKA